MWVTNKYGVVRPAIRRRRPFLFADEIFIDVESWLKMGAPASSWGGSLLFIGRQREQDGAKNFYGAKAEGRSARLDMGRLAPFRVLR